MTLEYTLKRTKRNRSMAIWWPFKKIPTIYLSNIRGEAGSEDYNRTLTHELVHVRQWYDLGRFKFLLKYITRKGRLELEAQAFATNILSYWKQNIFEFNVQYVPGLPMEPISVLDHYVNILNRSYNLWFVKKTKIYDVLLKHSNSLWIEYYEQKSAS